MACVDGLVCFLSVDLERGFNTVFFFMCFDSGFYHGSSLVVWFYVSTTGLGMSCVMDAIRLTASPILCLGGRVWLVSCGRGVGFWWRRLLLS